MQKRKKIIQILKNNGIELKESEIDIEIDVDSITFLQVLVDIEETFKVDLTNIENKNSSSNRLNVTELEEWLENNE